MYASYNDYLTCAAWSSTDENGEPLDSYQFSNSAETKMKEDLDKFVEMCQTELPKTLADYEKEGGTPEQFAHDFWLTRNGHGAGFWDRGLGEIGDIFTKASKTFGSCDLWHNPETLEIEVM